MDEIRQKIVDNLLELYYLKHDGHICEYNSWPAKENIHKLILSHTKDEDIISDANFSQLLNVNFETNVSQLLDTKQTTDETNNLKQTNKSSSVPDNTVSQTVSAPTITTPPTVSSNDPNSNSHPQEQPEVLETPNHEVAVGIKSPVPDNLVPQIVVLPSITTPFSTDSIEPDVKSHPQQEQVIETCQHDDIVSQAVSTPSTPPIAVLFESNAKSHQEHQIFETPKQDAAIINRSPIPNIVPLIASTPSITTPFIDSFEANAKSHQEQVFETAKHEAAVTSRIAELRKQGLWSAKRLPKLQEPPRPKTHWDYLLEEMKWLSTDFESERRWKRKAAKKCALMVYRYHQEKRSKIERAEREHIQHMKKLAATQSKEIRSFWSSMEEIVDFRQKTKLEETRKKAIGLHLNYILDETTKFTNTCLEDPNADSNNKTTPIINSSTKETDMEIDYPISQEGEKGEKVAVIKTEEQTEQQSKQEVDDIAAGAESIQPKGNTLETTTVSTKVPFLLKHSLREYQHIGLDWLVAMYNKKLNGILADEMGLGKTIQTIALLAHLACEKGDWGPHLIVVPTSVMLNWEMEIKKWCPAFKILTYYGNPKERKMKRIGWSRPNSFHICITSYRIVIQDHAAFRRKKWTYFILDEAHYIKNFKSQRWQMLLNFNSQRRLLLTGTPLQNDLMELWSLMHFLMPKFFDSCREFKDWFVNPLTGMIEGSHEYNEGLVARLHKVLRPFLLRRLKADVEKQLPRKREFIKTCRLSKRQRFLYEEFMSLSKTKETLASGSFLSVINVLMQLRKVCNHPNLFEPRPTISPLMTSRISYKVPGLLTSIIDYDPHNDIDLESLQLLLIKSGVSLTSLASEYVKDMLVKPVKLVEEMMQYNGDASDTASQATNDNTTILDGEEDPNLELIRSEKIQEAYALIKELREKEKRSRLELMASLNEKRCRNVRSPYYSDFQDHLDFSELEHLVKLEGNQFNQFSNGNGRRLCSSIRRLRDNPRLRLEYLTSFMDEAIKVPEQRCQMMNHLIERFVFCVPGASAPPISMHVSHQKPSKKVLQTYTQKVLYEDLAPRFNFLNRIMVNMRTCFPELRLIEYDCGKLQTLGRLLTELKSQDHRVLIFTQMSRMLDILEQFLNYHGHTYLRLDGATKIDQRQILMERFNNDRRIFCFILSTRSGGIGVNLTGADTVIFYDSDWNPTMDAQAQDRCHRIGQTRDVHIYRLISEDTIEKNIFMKAQQKRMLGDLAIEDGNFSTSCFKKQAIQDLFQVDRSNKEEPAELDKVIEVTRGLEMSKAQLNQLEQALSKGEAEAGECMDVDAIKVARADVDTDLREFDENIPITEDNSPNIQKSEQEQQIDSLVSQMSAIEQYAVKYLESLQKPKNKEELEQAELEYRMELENKKSQWEQSRMELLKEQESQLATQTQNDDDSNRKETMLTYPRGAKCEYVHFMLDGEKEVEELPLWAPPTPPTSPPSPVEESTNQHHYQPSMTPAMAARINAMGGLGNIFGFGSDSNKKDVKNFIDEKDLYIDFTNQFLYEPNVMLESQLPPINQEYSESEYTSYTIGSKKIRITGTPVVPNGYFQTSGNGPTSTPHLQNQVQNLKNIPTTPDGLSSSGSLVGQKVIANRKPKVRRDEVICLPKSIFDRQTPNFAKIRRELKLQKLRCVTKGNDSDPFAMQKFFQSFSLNPLGQSLPQETIVNQIQRQIQQFNDNRILRAYHQDQLPPWTIQEEWALLMIIQHLQDLPVNLCVLTPAHTPNWELVSEVVSAIGFTHRSFKMCEYHFAYTIQKREMTRDDRVENKTGQILSGDKSLQLSFGERYELIAKIRSSKPNKQVRSRFNSGGGIRGRPPGAVGPTPSLGLINNAEIRSLKPEVVIAEAAEQRKRQVFARALGHPMHHPPPN